MAGSSSNGLASLAGVGFGFGASCLADCSWLRSRCRRARLMRPTGRYTTTRGGCRQNVAKDAQSALDAKWNCDCDGDCDWLRCIGPVLACGQRRRLQPQQVASVARDCDGDCGMFYKWFSCSECVMFLGKDFFGPLLSWPSRGSSRVVMCVRKHETFKCTNEASGNWLVAGGRWSKWQAAKQQVAGSS